MAPDPDAPLRLERALAALFRFQQEGGAREAFLAAHADLRDVLEPMLEGLAADVPDPGVPTGDDVGRSVGGFRLERELGRGGVGVVYEAWHQTLQRRAAVKLLLPHLMPTPTAVGRFLREGRTLARLDHPGIVRVLDLGCEQGTHWLAMEFVEGVSFEQWLERVRGAGGLDGAALRGAVDIVAQVAAALQHAHDHGVIHRDIKPSNILVREDRTAVLTDFGLARGAELLTVTQPGTAAGTPYYMAPEQIRGGELDARVDVFALGVTLYEAVTLARPFQGGTTEAVLQAILRNEPQDPRRVNPQVAPELAAIIAMALDKDPARRYPDAAALARDLRAYLDFQPVRARRASGLVRLRRWVVREPLRALLAALLLLGVPTVAGLLGYVLALRPEAAAGRQALREVEFERLLAEGFHHHVAKRAARACRAFDQALAVLPRDPAALAGAALARQRRDGAEAALRYLDEMSAGLAPADEIGRVRGMLLRRLGRVEAAVALERALGEPQSSLALWLAAIAVFDLRGDGVEALRLVSLAVRVSPRPRATLWLQWCAYAINANDAAAMAEAAAAVTHLWPELWLSWQLAAAAWQYQDPARALAAQRRANALGADDELAFLNLASYLGKTGDMDGAIAALRDGAQRFPEDVELHFRLQGALTSQERPEEALAEYEVVRRLAPGHTAAMEQAAQALYLLHRDAEAIALFEHAVELAPQSWQLWSNFGVVLRSAGESARATQAQRKAVAADDTQPVAHQRLVQVLAEQGDQAGVMAELRRWAEARPEDPEAWLALSQAQQDAQAEPAEVMATALRAATVGRGRSRPALEHLAMVMAASGAREGAVQTWQQARALAAGDDPDSRRARARIDRELRKLGVEAAPSSQPERR